MCFLAYNNSYCNVRPTIRKLFSRATNDIFTDKLVYHILRSKKSTKVFLEKNHLFFLNKMHYYRLIIIAIVTAMVPLKSSIIGLNIILLLINYFIIIQSQKNQKKIFKNFFFFFIRG